MGEWPENLVKIARERLAAKTVSRTRYGIRVECRVEFSDNRAEAKAYWLGTTDDPVRCRCWKANANEGLCSHEVAARLFEREPFNPYA